MKGTVCSVTYSDKLCDMYLDTKDHLLNKFSVSGHFQV